jgi:hypothetical protein
VIFCLYPDSVKLSVDGFPCEKSVDNNFMLREDPEKTKKFKLSFIHFLMIEGVAANSLSFL